MSHSVLWHRVTKPVSWVITVVITGYNFITTMCIQKYNSCRIWHSYMTHIVDTLCHADPQGSARSLHATEAWSKGYWRWRTHTRTSSCGSVPAWAAFRPQGTAFLDLYKGRKIIFFFKILSISKTIEHMRKKSVSVVLINLTRGVADSTSKSHLNNTRELLLRLHML